MWRKFRKGLTSLIKKGRCFKRFSSWHPVKRIIMGDPQPFSFFVSPDIVHRQSLVIFLVTTNSVR